MKKKFTFLVIDSSVIVSLGLNHILMNRFNFLIYNTTNFFDIERIIKEVNIDLVFLEIIQNDKLELSIISKIRKLRSDIKILVFTLYNDEKLLDEIKRNDDVIILRKSASKNEIIKKVNQIIGYNEYEKVKGVKTFLLSQRENQIAQMLLDGKKNIEISNLLNLSTTTVATYKHRILQKFKIKNIIELHGIYRS